MWTESQSASFFARHEDRDVEQAAQVLQGLEETREQLLALFPEAPRDVTVVLHGSSLGLSLAHPVLPLFRLLTAPAARRYLAGWLTADELHVLTPSRLDRRASAVEGSREVLQRTPAALYVRMTVGASNPRLPPPFTPGAVVRAARWAWLVEGAAQLLSGQTRYARGAIARRLREGGRPDFPPGVRDATLLGGTVLDLLAREEGLEAVARLVTRLHPDGAQRALVQAFSGRSITRTEQAWRSHLERITGR